jgi:hypothetical protein
MPTLALLALTSLTPGCLLGRSATNEPIDPALLSLLRPGESTAGDVTELLGGPSQIVELGDRTAYLYDQRTTKAAGLVFLLVNVATIDSRSDRVWVFFDEDLTLTHYGATLTGHRAQYAMPWNDLHDAAGDRAMDARRPGLPPNGRTGG